MEKHPEMYPNVNAGIPHLLLLVLIDMSSSMACSVDKMKKALIDLEAALKGNDKANASVEVAFVIFNSCVTNTPFMPLSYYECPEVTASGCTSLYEALEVGVKLDRERKDFLRSKGTGHYRSWTMILTDGMPTDTNNGQVDMLLNAQKRGSMNVYPVAIGEHANKEFLASLSINGEVISATRENFDKAIVWLSNSIIDVSNSKPGEEVRLSNPNEPQYGGIVYEQIPVKA